MPTSTSPPPLPPELIPVAARQADDWGVFVFFIPLALASVFAWRWLKTQEDTPPGRGDGGSP